MNTAPTTKPTEVDKTANSSQSVVENSQSDLNHKHNATTVNSNKPVHAAQATSPTGWTAPDKPLKPLTRKQQAFVKHLVENPKASATEAVRATYNVTTDNSASQIATENLRKPQVLLELAKHSANAELTLLDMMQTSSKYAKRGDKGDAQYASVAVQSANSILDRLHGKATQRTEVESKSVTINLDLSGM